MRSDRHAGAWLAVMSAVMLALPAAAAPATASVMRLCGGGTMPSPVRGDRRQDCPGACHAACVRRSGKDGVAPGEPEPDA